MGLLRMLKARHFIRAIRMVYKLSQISELQTHDSTPMLNHKIRVIVNMGKV